MHMCVHACMYAHVCVRAYVCVYALGLTYTALTGNFLAFQHLLPTPVHSAVMGPGIFWGVNSLAMAYQSAKGSGGTSDAHTHKLRVLVSPPASS